MFQEPLKNNWYQFNTYFCIHNDIPVFVNGINVGNTEISVLKAEYLLIFCKNIY